MKVALNTILTIKFHTLPVLTMVVEIRLSIIYLYLTYKLSQFKYGAKLAPAYQLNSSWPYTSSIMVTIRSSSSYEASIGSPSLLSSSNSSISNLRYQSNKGLLDNKNSPDSQAITPCLNGSWEDTHSKVSNSKSSWSANLGQQLEMKGNQCLSYLLT